MPVQIGDAGSLETSEVSRTVFQIRITKTGTLSIIRKDFGSLIYLSDTFASPPGVFRIAGVSSKGRGTKQRNYAALKLF